MKHAVRKAIFWAHLVAGLTAAIGVVVMSLTGVLLTYDRQIRDWAAEVVYAVDAEGTKLTVDELAAAAEDFSPTAIVMFADPDKLPRATQGRRNMTYLDPYTGEMLGRGNDAVNSFLASTNALHRRLALTGDAQGMGRAFTGASNLLFAFLLLSGMYLWLPPAFKWAMTRPRLLLKRTYVTKKARNYHWHHVFAFWSLVPLLAIVLSGVTLSYEWADDLSVTLFGGDDAPTQPARGNSEVLVRDGVRSLQSLFEGVDSASPGWQSMQIAVVDPQAASLDVLVDFGTGGQPTKHRTITVGRKTGQVLGTEAFSDRVAERQVFLTIRFLHTGEYFGLIGQTIAGLVSALSLVLVWTGVALAWRRLIKPRRS